MAQFSNFSSWQPLRCTLPWGGTIGGGASVTAYSSTSPTGPCSAVSQTRTCVGSTLSGTFLNSACTNGCTGTPWGSVSSGYSNTAYSTSNPAGPCAGASQTRTCSNGSLSGSYTVTSCTNGCAAQTTSWSSCSGNTTALSSGGSMSVTNSNGGYSGSVTVTCTNGTLAQSGATCTSPYHWTLSTDGCAEGPPDVSFLSDCPGGWYSAPAGTSCTSPGAVCRAYRVCGLSQSADIFTCQ